MRITNLCLICCCCCCALLLERRAVASSPVVGQLVTVEKSYDVPQPVGRVTVRYDETDPEKPTLVLRSDVLSGEVSAEALRDLPRPDWGRLYVGFSVPMLRDRPHVFISVPLHGPRGVTWPTTSVLFAFDEHGKLTKRGLQQFVPLKGRHPRMDLPLTDADAIGVLSEPWPIGSAESAEQVLARAREQNYPATRPADE
jgi:hypothetical protein